jgi:hypothetical protein
MDRKHQKIRYASSRTTKKQVSLAKFLAVGKDGAEIPSRVCC